MAADKRITSTIIYVKNTKVKIIALIHAMNSQWSGIQRSEMTAVDARTEWQ